MPPLEGVNWWPALAALAASLVLTPVVRALARRHGAVAQPRGDRWHKKPTALLGGVAIFASVTGVSLLLLPRSPELLTVLGAAGFLWLIGLIDDFVRLKPYQKLIAQVMAAAVVAYSGLRLPWTASPALNIGFTLLWLVGITNAVNLLDNMDGLAGVVGIASLFLGAVFLDNGQAGEAQTMTVFAAALVASLSITRTRHRSSWATAGRCSSASSWRESPSCTGRPDGRVACCPCSPCPCSCWPFPFSTRCW